MTTGDPATRYLYWLTREDFDWAKGFLQQLGYNFDRTLMTPCQVLTARGQHLVYAPPGVWNGMCRRQGSWYRESHRAGQYMIMSDHPLPDPLPTYLDAEMRVSDFAPESLPTDAELENVIASGEYRSRKPKDWERITWRDSALFKVFFTFTRFWKRNDNLATHWLGQRANHANFLSRKYTTEFDGEEVPYSVTENKRVCSSCAEFFNVIEPGARKLVRACPGSIVLGGATRDVYYDVQPLGTKIDS